MAYDKAIRAMVLERPGMPLRLLEKQDPIPGPGKVLVRVTACGVCRTDLHVVDGDLTEPKLPIIPGHEIVGTVIGIGRDVDNFKEGDRIGIPWLGRTCGHCSYCVSGDENLCDEPGFTGYQIDGGYADMAVAEAHFCFPISNEYSDVEAAPLLCAGLIGYRSLSMVGERVESIGIFGFGAAAHIVTQLALHKRCDVYAFTRPGDKAAQQFALNLGAIWAGSSDRAPPKELDAAIIFAPVGSLVPAALRSVRKGGVVVCGGIHMSDIPSFPYEVLWGERCLRSVANLTRQDAVAFLELAPKIPVKTTVEKFQLDEANAALEALRTGRLTCAAVLIP